MPIARLARLLPLLAAIAGCAAHDDFDFDTCGVRPRAAIPVDMRNGVPIIEATIKGQPAHFVLDTGATGVVLTEDALRRLDIRSDPHKTINSVGAGGMTRSFAGKLEDFRIAGLPVPDHTVAVLPASSSVTAAAAIDGLFGVSVLSVFEVELDFPNRRATLYAGHLCRDTVAPPWLAGAAALDASRSEKGRFLVPVQLHGRDLTALLDTGAAKTTVARDIALAVGVAATSLALDPPVNIVGVGPNVPVGRLHRFHDIRLAGQVYDEPDLVVAEREEIGVDMIIGSDFLAGRRVWLSYARRVVFIELPKPQS